MTGIVAGNNGTILKTTNSGNVWVLNTITSNTLYDVFMIGNTGWVCGQNGYIAKTTNFGTNWITQTSNTGFTLRSIFFRNINDGWIVGDSGIVKRSTNSGNTWVEQNSGINIDLNCVYFHDTQLGWASGRQGNLIRTTNGGSNWINSYVARITGEKLFFLNANTGWLCGWGTFGSYDSTLVKTTNGGLTWLPQASQILADILGVYFVNENLGWICCNGGFIYVSTNGGNNWYEQSRPVIMPLHDIMFVDSNIGWSVGQSGSIVSTTNGGGAIGIQQISNEVPKIYSISQNHPNPFNPKTSIKIGLKEASHVELTIYDILGREIEKLVNQELNPGYYNVDFNGDNYPSGMYFYRLETDGFSETKKMVIVK